jgi:hypothetical protein
MLEDLTVGEAQNAEPREAKPAVALMLVGRDGKVVRAIGFDDEKSLLTEKVDDERAEGLLTAKFRAVESTISKEFPKTLLRRRRVTTQRTSLKCRLSEQTAHEPFSAADELCCARCEGCSSPLLPPGEGVGG